MQMDFTISLNLSIGFDLQPDFFSDIENASYKSLVVCPKVHLVKRQGYKLSPAESIAEP